MSGKKLTGEKTDHHIGSYQKVDGSLVNMMSSFHAYDVINKRSMVRYDSIAKCYEPLW